MSDTQALDDVMPFRGPCELHGGPDARHRVCDAIAERIRANESALDVARDYFGDIDAEHDAIDAVAVAAAYGEGHPWEEPALLAELEDIHQSQDWADAAGRELLRSRIGGLVDLLRGD